MIERLLLGLLLGGLRRTALPVIATVVVAVMLALAFAVSSLIALVSVPAPGRQVAGAQPAAIPADQLAAIQAAARHSRCGVPWQILAAIAEVESDFGRNMATSSAGAIGYGQFLPSTWDAYGQGRNPYDYHDALPAMAQYLCDHGAPQHLRAALYAYNHAEWYVDAILAVAVRYGYLPAGTAPAQVVTLALAQAGTPYVWGGVDPTTGFDCSGLVQWVYRQVGVALPRTAQQQYDATARVSRANLQPGDLVFFAQTYPSAEYITHVGIYLGGGLMVNAPVEGQPVGEMPVFDGFWGAHYAGAGRVVVQ